MACGKQGGEGSPNLSIIRRVTCQTVWHFLPLPAAHPARIPFPRRVADRPAGGCCSPSCAGSGCSTAWTSSAAASSPAAVGGQGNRRRTARWEACFEVGVVVVGGGPDPSGRANGTDLVFPCNFLSVAQKGHLPCNSGGPLPYRFSETERITEEPVQHAASRPPEGNRIRRPGCQHLGHTATPAPGHPKDFPPQ